MGFRASLDSLEGKCKIKLLLFFVMLLMLEKEAFTIILFS